MKNSRLADLIRERKLNVTQAAKEIGICPAHLYNIIKGHPAGRQVAEKIETWSQNTITKESLAWPKKAA